MDLSLQEEIVITITRDKESLTPLLVNNLSTFVEFQRMVEKSTRLTKTRLFYIDEEGDAVCLDSEDEFKEAVRQANETKQLHILVEDIEKSKSKLSRHHHHHHHCHHSGHRCNRSHETHYVELANSIGEDRRKAAKVAAAALLSKPPCATTEEPEWFTQGMEKYTKQVIEGVVSGLENNNKGPSTNVIHYDIVCDGCQKGIVGVRYKCGNCADYDLCENCETLSEFVHRGDHVFLKIKTPVRYAGVNKKGKCKPLLKRNLYELPKFVVEGWEIPVPCKMEEPSCKEEMLTEACNERQTLFQVQKSDLAQNQFEIVAPPEKELQQELADNKSKKIFIRHTKKQLRKDLKKSCSDVPVAIDNPEALVRFNKKQVKELIAAKQKRKKQYQQLLLTDPPVPPSVDLVLKQPTFIEQKGHGKSLDAKFIADASLPDDSVVRYGKGFSKSWLVENTGTKQWQNVQLIHQDGFLPIQSEVDIPDLVPGEQTEIVVNYPAVSPDDGIDIKSSWRLIYNKMTPFGCTLWLSVIAQPDPVEELVNTFEQITYPKFDEDKKSEDDNEEDTEDECKVDVISEGFTVIDPLTPVESLNSCKDDGYSDDEFMVVIPDCFKLDVPLEGFSSDFASPVSTPVHEDSTLQEPTVEIEQEEETQDEQKVQNETVTSEELSKPKNHKRAYTFTPNRTTLSDAWISRSRKPVNYAIGLINTVTDFVDQHIPPTTAVKPKGDNSTSDPLLDIIKQEPDVSRFINNKWEEPQPSTPMDQLISMGFANRALNDHLLKKHNNDFAQVVNELLETDGEGYHTPLNSQLV